jgi:hypothetical protein
VILYDDEIGIKALDVIHKELVHRLLAIGMCSYSEVDAER